MLTQVARVKCVQEDEPCTKDVTLWHASVAQVWLGLFDFDGITPLSSTELTGFTSATLEVWSDEHNNATLLATTTIVAANFNSALTLTDWDDKVNATIKFSFTAEQLNLEIQGTFVKYWYVIYLTSPSGRHVIAGGKFILQRNQAGAIGSPPTPPDNFYTKAELDALLLALGVSESPYVVCDTEAEVNAALLQGRWIVLRGEGNGGVINFSTIKYIDVPGTKVIGYGYKPNGGSNQYAQVVYNYFPQTKPFSTQFPDILFYVRANNVELAGFEMRGLATLSTTIASCIGIIISAEHEVNNLQIRDITARNMRNFVSKQGAQGVPATQKLVIERCRVTNLTHFGLNLRESFYDAVIRDNVFECREAGGPNPPEFQWMQGMQIDSDIKNCLIENNKILRPARMGIELIAEGYAAPVFTAMLQNRIVGNTVLDAGSMGISITYSTDTIIAENIIDGAVSIGLESSNGHTYLESSNRHQCKLINNIIRNVTSPANFVSGISLDSSFGDEVYGNTIEHVSSGYTNANLSQQASYCRGIVLQRARRAKIRHNTFNYVDGVGIFAQPGNGQYQHVDRIVIENNEFFLDAAQTKAYFAMWLQGSRAVVRNNVSWVPSAWTGPTPNRGGFLGEFQGTTPIEIGNEASMPAYSNYFRDTNLLLSY